MVPAERSHMAKQFKELTFSDSYIFGQVMKDPVLCRKVLEVLLGEDIGELEPVETERIMQFTKDGKPIRLDILTRETDTGRYHDVEMQNKGRKSINDLALGNRSRYYQGITDAILTEKGTNYKDLKESIILFICTFDPFGEGRYCYTFQNRCDESPELLLGDGTKKIFFNTKSREQEIPESVKRLFNYIETGNIGNALTEQIENAVIDVKGREDIEMGFWSVKCHDDDIRDEGREEGREESLVISIRNLMETMAWTADQAMDALKIPVSDREKLSAQL